MNDYMTGTTANYTTATGISSGYVYVDGGGLVTSNIKINERSKDMMGLYEVYVVDTKKGKVLIHNDIVAENEDKAKLKVAMGHSTDIPDDVEFFVDCIGQWESRKPKEVKIVK